MPLTKSAIRTAACCPCGGNLCIGSTVGKASKSSFYSCEWCHTCFVGSSNIPNLLRLECGEDFIKKIELQAWKAHKSKWIKLKLCGESIKRPLGA